MQDLRRLKIATQTNRQKILEILSNDGLDNNAQSIADQLKIDYKNAVFHLRILSHAGLVEGKFALKNDTATKCYYITPKGRQMFQRIAGLK